MPNLDGRGYVERANVIYGQTLNVNGISAFSREFPMGEGWYKMNLRVNISLTHGTGTTPITEGELLFIKNILLRTDRGEILCNLPGRALYKIAAWKVGSPPRKNAIAATTAVYSVNLPIYFADWDMMRPEDTILDTSRYNSVFLQVQLGTVADLLGTPGTDTVTATLDVEVERSLGALPAKGKPIFHSSYDYRPPVDAANLQFIDIERSADMSVKRLYIFSGTSGTAGVPCSGTLSDAVQNLVTIKDQNRFIEKERIHSMIQDGNQHDAGLESVLTGIEVFDFVSDGAVASALATGDKSVLQYTWSNQGGVGANSIVTLVQEAIRTLK